MKHVVREIKKYHHIEVANALNYLGWYWEKPNRRPTNIEVLCSGIPKGDLLRLLNRLRSKKR